MTLAVVIIQLVTKQEFFPPQRAHSLASYGHMTLFPAKSPCAREQCETCDAKG